MYVLIFGGREKVKLLLVGLFDKGHHPSLLS